ncbi:MAG: rRNA maturation RNase YbeY [Candidatus Hydrogenedentes bacterium]|nr:rRNA maturation RNase YbeY [Candidatus Hydrogenedentota bacterium]
MIKLLVKNVSNIRGMYSKKDLERILSKIESGEKLDNEEGVISLILCGDVIISELNKRYRGKNTPTDVLSFPVPREFPQTDEKKLLGEVYISLETVLNRNAGDSKKAKAEVRLLFCHGVLHLLGYTHDNYVGRKVMMEKQSNYLGIPISEAWIKYSKNSQRK